MAIIPTGSPAWTRTADFSHYGGNASKEDYLGRGAIDARTDVAAAEFSRMVADAAACTRSAPFAVITFRTNDTAPAAPTVEAAYLMTGIQPSGYAGASPPTGFPSAARNGDGDATFTFAASYTDEYGVSGAFTPRHVSVSLGGQIPGMCTWEITGSTVRVRAFSDAGAALQNVRVTLEVH